MEKTLRAAMNPQGRSVALKAITFTVDDGNFESTVYIVLERNIDGSVSDYHQFDTEIKAQRKFNRLTK